jgi:TRAP-type C4-dicarboxylate transport system permease small subunit
MTAPSRLATRLIDPVLWLSKAFVFATSVVFVVLVVLQVFFRYAMNDSLMWAEEAIRFLLYLTVMGSLGLVSATGADIRLDGLDGALPPRLKSVLGVACDLIVLIFCAVFIYASVRIVGMSWGQRSPVMEISMGWIYSAGIMGVVLAVLGTVRKLAAGMLRLDAADDNDLQYKA